MTRKSMNQFARRACDADEEFDIEAFDREVAGALGIELPGDYAARKAAKLGPGHPVKPVDQYSFGRKLMAMLGPDWTWQSSDNGGSGSARVWNTEDTAQSVEKTALSGELALRAAALRMLAKR